MRQKLNYAWYSKTAETPKVRISTRQNMDGATEFTGAQTEAVTIDTTKYFSNKVTVSGLKENTSYYYQVFQDGKWQDTQNYTTQAFDEFFFFCMSEIRRSGLPKARPAVRVKRWKMQEML